MTEKSAAWPDRKCFPGKRPPDALQEAGVVGPPKIRVIDA